MGFSTSDLTLLRIRCDACKQYTERLVTLLLRKGAMTCAVCKAAIDLTTPHNALLIKETAESCERIGAALIAQAAEADEPA
ncbi:MAG TPA: hypothetical protein VEK73_03225 [Xanthobacteraceae bacterium]|nr:hypothetical protein [Xanthobacteraceae bacterium]